MKLALQTDYALRVLLYLATEEGRTTVGELAAFYGISVNHLGKVVHQLGRLGFVRNVRGPGGGIELAREAAGFRWARWSATSRGETFTCSNVSIGRGSA